jgi:hypothetical protein
MSETTADQDDAALLREAGWKDNGDGTWTNTRRFRYYGKPDTQDYAHLVPDGVTRATREAAELERRRPPE